MEYINLEKIISNFGIMRLADYIKTELPKWPNWINKILLKLNVFGSKVYGKSYERAIKEIEELCPEEKLCEIVNFAIKNVPYYRKKYGNLQIKSIKEFEEKIAFIDKDEVMTHWEDFLIDNIDWSKCVTGTTGGTSGKPLKVVIPNNRYIREAVFVNKYRGKSGWATGEYRAMIRNHRIPANRDYIINPVTRDFIFDAFRINEKYAFRIYKAMKKHNIRFIHAYPSAVCQFLRLCKSQNLDLSFIKAVLLSSEAVTEDQAWLITKTCGLKLSYTYGHSEKLIFAANDCSDMDLIVDSKYGYFELIDKDGKPIDTAGEIGEMVGTTFFNKYMPLIRYRTGDFAELGEMRNENKTLKKIYGRRDKSIIYRCDNTQTSLTALNLHNDFYEHINGIQYIQEEKGKLIVLIIRNEKYCENDEIFILDHLGNAMLGKENVEIRYVDKLIIQPNGKFLPIISKI